MNAPFPHPQPQPPPKTEPGELLGPLPARRVVKKAVILAAGRGKRMGKLTKDRPKAALEVGGHALIDWQIAALQAAGVEEIAVVTGHGAAALAGRGVTYIHNPNWDKGTQVATLLCARDWIGDEPVIVSYGDIIYHPCAPLALLERPGDIIIAYDADHRWLWKRRFGNWLRDSETFRLGPGQVLTEIGGKPTDIEEMDGQFMGLMLVTASGLDVLAAHFRQTPAEAQRKLDFTKLLSQLLAEGVRIDTAANVLPWMEVDGAKDLKIARAMCERDVVKGNGPQLIFPSSATPTEEEVSPAYPQAKPLFRSPDYAAIRDYRVENVFAVQNWGRSGSTFLQSLFDDHPQILSTPNFYSRRFFMAWASEIVGVPDERKVDAFLDALAQWWDTRLVDAAAGLHRLGPERRALAGVRRETLEGYLRAAFATGRCPTRRNLFEAAHLAYALARGQRLAARGLQVLYPIHGEPRSVACALLEDYPDARFIHTVREPVANVAATLRHYRFNSLDIRVDPLEATLQNMFGQRASRYGRPLTVFADRAYLSHLAQRDRACFLRLEDLHETGADLMLSASRWLGIEDHPRLMVSTWDGQTWWNRPESGRESRLGYPPSAGNLSEKLHPADQGKVKTLLRLTGGVQSLYGSVEPWPPSIAHAMTSVMTPWRQERRSRRTEHRCLEALRKISPLLPGRFVRRLDQATERERKRAELLGMASGGAAVRATLPDTEKAGTVHALLLLSASLTGWRVRALAKTWHDRLEQPDRIAVTCLDEVSAARDLSSHAFWLIVLSIGWPVSRLITFVRIRALMARASLSGPRRDGQRLTILAGAPAQTKPRETTPPQGLITVNTS